MKTYQYQILRYLPDRINAEFVNVGLVFYSHDEKYLKAKFINRSKRLSSFFPGLDVQHIMQGIAHLQKGFEFESSKLKEEFSFKIPDSIEKITSNLLVKDDTSLVFTDVFKGIDISLDSAFENIVKQMIFKYDYEKKNKTSMSDNDVWAKVYSKYFKKAGIESNLQEHSVQTNYTTLKFSKAWQNKIWHCYEPVSFKLVNEEYIKNKMLHWTGVLKWLETATEPVRVDLLSVMPTDKNQKDLIRKAFKDKKAGASVFSIIEENEAEKFVKQLSIEFQEHKSKE